jgi:hypothetical protein
MKQHYMADHISLHDLLDGAYVSGFFYKREASTYADEYCSS